MLDKFGTGVSRNFAWILLGIVLLALALRLGVCIELSGIEAVVKPEVKSDMDNYLQLMRRIWAGDWPDHFDFQPFYYTVFLPLCRLIGGDNPWPIMLLQCILGAGAVALTGLCAAKLFGRPVGALGALLLALFKIHIFFTPFALFEVLQSFWIILLLWMGLLCMKRNKWWQWVLAALVLSFSTLTRGNALFLLPVFMLALVWRNRFHLQTLWLALAFLLVFSLPRLPFSIRNYHWAGRWVGPSTAGDKVLILGNSPEAPAGLLLYPQTYHYWTLDTEKRPEQGRISAKGRILKWALQEPLLFLDLQFRKCLLFWNRIEISHNVALKDEGGKSWTLKLPFLLPFAVLGVLCLFGLCRERRILETEHAFLFAFLLVCWLGTALFYILSRFRLTTMPLICIYGGYGIWELLRLPSLLKSVDSSRRWRIVGINCFIVIAAIFLTGKAYPLWCRSFLTFILERERPNGQLLVFEKEGFAVLRDNGPLLEPERYTLFVCSEQAINTIVKRLVIPPEAVGKPCTLHLPVRFMDTPNASGFLRVGDKRYRLDASKLVEQEDHSLAFVVKLDAIPQDGLFIFHFPARYILPIDETTYYHRTEIFVGDEPHPYLGELAMEISWELDK